ncbi:MAG: hypothetical protein Q9222_003276 [Ikaeria aurantiellina]
MVPRDNESIELTQLKKKPSYGTVSLDTEPKPTTPPHDRDHEERANALKQWKCKTRIIVFLLLCVSLYALVNSTSLEQDTPAVWSPHFTAAADHRFLHAPWYLWLVEHDQDAHDQDAHDKGLATLNHPLVSKTQPMFYSKPTNSGANQAAPADGDEAAGPLFGPADSITTTLSSQQITRVIRGREDLPRTLTRSANGIARFRRKKLAVLPEGKLSNSSTKKIGLKIWSLVGIVALIIAVTAIEYFIRRKRQRRNKPSTKEQTAPLQLQPIEQGDLHGNPVSEVSANHPDSNDTKQIKESRFWEHVRTFFSGDQGFKWAFQLFRKISQSRFSELNEAEKGNNVRKSQKQKGARVEDKHGPGSLDIPPSSVPPSNNDIAVNGSPSSSDATGAAQHDIETTSQMSSVPPQENSSDTTVRQSNHGSNS